MPDLGMIGSFPDRPPRSCGVMGLLRGGTATPEPWDPRAGFDARSGFKRWSVVTQDGRQENSTASPAAVFDFDGTLVHEDTTLCLVGFVLRQYPRALQDLPPMLLTAPLCLSGLVSRDRLKRLAVRLLRNIPPDKRDGLFRDFHDRCIAPRYLAAGLKRIRWHREEGHTLILVSASIDLYLRHVARHLEFDDLVCTRVTLEPIPCLLSPNCRGVEKVRRLAALELFRRTRWSESWAYSDSLSDLPILHLCGHPVASNPTRSLRRHAERTGWTIMDW